MARAIQIAPRYIPTLESIQGSLGQETLKSCNRDCIYIVFRKDIINFNGTEQLIVEVIAAAGYFLELFPMASAAVACARYEIANFPCK